MTLTLKVTFHQQKQYLAVHESLGYLQHWASFGTLQRDPCKSDLATPGGVVTLGPITLPAVDAIRGDETISLAQFDTLDTSGVASIDAKEAGHTEWTAPAGMTSPPLQLLLKAALTGDTLEKDLVDNTCLGGLLSATGLVSDEQFKVLEAKSKKGHVTIEASVSAPTEARLLYEALRERMRSPPPGVILYQTPAMLARMNAVRETTMTAHARYFFRDEEGGAPLHPINPREPSLDPLHLVSYQSEHGWLPVAYYTVAAEHPDTTAVYTRESALFAVKQLEASLHRAGMSAATFVKAIAAQHMRAKGDRTVDATYKRACAVILDAATFPANSANYTSDMRFPNPSAEGPPPTFGAAPLGAHPLWSKVLPTLGAASTKRPGAARRAHRKFRRDYAQLCAMTGGPVDPNHGMDVEDFGVALRAGLSASEDCEGDETMASHIAGIHGEMPTHDLELLEAAQSVYQRRIFFDVAANVTSGFYDAKGEEIAFNRATMDLPMIGDEMDLRSGVAGHCPGVWVPMALAAQWYQNGGADLDKDMPEMARALANAAAWEVDPDTAGTLHVSEGTGDCDPFVLPTEEVFPGEPPSRARATYATLREKAPVLMDICKPGGLSFYDKAQPEERRVSSFYRGFSMGMSRQVMRINPVYASAAFVNMGDKTRGAEIASLLRPGSAKRFALVSANASLGREYWAREVQPLAECILNQMPRSTYARFVAAPQPNRMTFEQACLRANHVLSDKVVRALQRTGAPETELGTILDRHSLGATRMATLAAGPAAAAARGGMMLALDDDVDIQPSRVVTLYTQPWHLAPKGEAVYAELAALEHAGVLASHDMARNRPLPPCQDVIELRLVLPPA